MAPLIVELFKQTFQTLPLAPQNAFFDKIAIVTGSNVGLGFEAARHLLTRGARLVILAVRDVAKGEAAKQELLKTPGINLPETIAVWQVDQASFASVTAFCERANRELPRLDLLILNAGVATAIREETVDGWEKTVQVNVLSTTLIALMLLPKMIAQSLAGPGTDYHIPRFVILASGLHAESKFEESMQPNILEYLSSKENWDRMEKVFAGIYSTTKLLNVYTAQRIVNFIPEHPSTRVPAVIATSVDPGLCYSELGREGRPLPIRIVMKMVARTSEEGSRTHISAALAGKEAHGGYMGSCVVKTPSPTGLAVGRVGAQAGDKVWAEIVSLLKEVHPSVKEFVERKRI